MNAKCVVALILVLQASMSLCEIPAPSQELVEKYENMRSVFYRRLVNAYNRLKESSALSPEQQEKMANALQAVESNPQAKALGKVLMGLGQEAGPLVDNARTKMLAAYEHYLRAHVGTHLDQGINFLKSYLDQVMPAE